MLFHLRRVILLLKTCTKNAGAVFLALQWCFTTSQSFYFLMLPIILYHIFSQTQNVGIVFQNRLIRFQFLLITLYHLIKHCPFCSILFNFTLHYSKIDCCNCKLSMNFCQKSSELGMPREYDATQLQYGKFYLPSRYSNLLLPNFFYNSFLQPGGK